MTDLHDWSLDSVSLQWDEGIAHMRVRGPLGMNEIIARGVSDLSVPRHYPWGPSISINHVTGPQASGSGAEELLIEMQTGDVIRVVADKFEMPEPQS